VNALPYVVLALATLAPPATLMEQFPQLKQIDRMACLPQAIQAGQFTVDGTSAARWQIAEPHGKFSATDVPVPGAPGRRLIFAACDAALCLIHYERGGIAHFYEILALLKTTKGWTAIWNARGPTAFANLQAISDFLHHPSSARGWNDQWVKGDF
jgi:hypothetical protein